MNSKNPGKIVKISHRHNEFEKSVCLILFSGTFYAFPQTILSIISAL